MDLTILYITAGGAFLVSIFAHIYVKIALRPKDDSDFDDYYYEVEDRHPGFAKYDKWSRITFASAVISALVLFVLVAVL